MWWTLSTYTTPGDVNLGLAGRVQGARNSHTPNGSGQCGCDSNATLTESLLQIVDVAPEHQGRGPSGMTPIAGPGTGSGAVAPRGT